MPWKFYNLSFFPDYHYPSHRAPPSLRTPVHCRHLAWEARDYLGSKLVQWYEASAGMAVAFCETSGSHRFWGQTPTRFFEVISARGYSHLKSPLQDISPEETVWLTVYSLKLIHFLRFGFTGNSHNSNT